MILDEVMRGVDIFCQLALQFRDYMKKIRKVVIPAAGPQSRLAFAFGFYSNTAHAAFVTGQAVLKSGSKERNL